MTQAGSAAAPLRTGRGTYFFLSYAHSAPTSDHAQTDTDPWVRVFFDDLSGAVRRHARPVSGMDIGFFDQQVPIGADWKAALVEALGGAQVFVPLYSPRYLNGSWPMRERGSFLERLATSGTPAPARHVAPVLWIPFPPWDGRPEISQALEFGEAIPEYAENGMRALCMLALYRDQYSLLVDELATRIVALAEGSPLRRSDAPDLNTITTDAAPTTETAFTVAVTAPTATDLPPDRVGSSYGAQSTLWRPFADRQALPVAEYAASIAERGGFQARITQYPDRTLSFDKTPAVLLVDPWVTAGTGGAQTLRAATKDLPEWVVPLVIADQNDEQYAERGSRLADDVMAMLGAAGVPRAKCVGEVEEFVEIMPSLVAEARREYLRNGPVYPPPGVQAERPTLRGSDTATPPRPREAEQ